MDLAPDAAGHARRVVIQLMPAPFSQGWTSNIRKLVAAHWFDGIAVVRVQDNYVVQWGDPNGDDPKKARALPEGLRKMTAADYQQPSTAPLEKAAHEQARMTAGMTDPYAHDYMFWGGFPIAMSGDSHAFWPLHCYGAVGVGRDMSPDAGTGAELYTVIGQAPRQLDRNIAVVGRIVDGMANLSSLPRGTGEMGFYKTAAERTPIVTVRMGDTVADLPAYEYLSTDSASFAAYLHSRANRQDGFYSKPAGGVDICNAPVPIREAP